MSDEVLGDRALNRALLARQHLLESADLGVADAVEHLLGLQAQAPLPPYLALRARLRGFDPDELGRMLADRDVVRLTLMRGTVHLVTVADALVLRPLVQAVIERGFQGAFGKRMGGAAPERIAAVARELLADEALTARELGRALVQRGIGEDVEAIGSATRVHAPLVQVPPRGVWGRSGQARYAALQDWTGRELAPDPSIDAILLRYLGAFGPASVMDAQSWSGLTRLAEAFERLRPRLVTFRSERGRELFDLPEAPRPAEDVPAPVRLLGEFDNVLLGHADRARIIPEDLPWRPMLDSGRALSHVLVDGRLRAGWRLDRDGRRAVTIAVRPAGKLTRAERDAIADEARGVLDFLAPDAERRDVRVEKPV